MAAATQSLHKRKLGMDGADHPAAAGVYQGGSGQDAARRNRLKALAQQPGVLVSSPVLFNLLLVTPLICWFIALAWGMLAFTGLPASKRDVRHMMVWFDVGVFRTLAGPAIPLVVLVIRALASVGLAPPASTRPASQQQQAPGIELQPAGGPQARYSSVTPGISVRGTLLKDLGVIYVMVTLGRMSLYVLHLAAQHTPLAQHEPLKPAAYMSDHVLLGASVLACLQVELLCGVSDMIKLSAVRTATWRHVIALLSIILAAAMAACITLDMHYTGRYFHHPQETLAACVLGAALFQVPLMLWVKRQWKTV